MPTKKNRPNIVVLGGGTGLSVMLRGLKQKPVDITAIVTVADDGGSSGILRNELNMPPPGDIRNVLTALADVEPSLSDMLEYRFKAGSALANHSLGNLILAAMTDISGDFMTAIRELSRVFAVKGKVLPATDRAIVLHAQMADGAIVTGESQIPKYGHAIERVFLGPEFITALPEAIEAIQQADGIVLGPGSLYTSVLPTLLVPKIAESIVNTKHALKLYICNIMTQPGETDNYMVSDHIHAIQKHIGHEIIDCVVVNSSIIPEHIQQKYAQEGARPVLFDIQNLKSTPCSVVSDRFVSYQTYLRHDSAKLSKHIYDLTANWIKKRRESIVFCRSDEKRTNDD